MLISSCSSQSSTEGSNSIGTMISSVVVSTCTSAVSLTVSFLDFTYVVSAHGSGSLIISVIMHDESRRRIRSATIAS